MHKHRIRNEEAAISPTIQHVGRTGDARSSAACVTVHVHCIQDNNDENQNAALTNERFILIKLDERYIVLVKTFSKENATRQHG